MKPFGVEKLILSNTVFLYSHYQNLAQAASGKACRAGEVSFVQMIDLSVKRLSIVSGYYILCLCSLLTQYVVINQALKRI